jgi:pimeloyl-ACP methyl ester carboxylesterase
MAQGDASARQTLVIAGRKLHFFQHTVQHTLAPQTQGTLPPLLLIHGAGGNHLQWPARLRRSATTSVYALDLPGHGRSAGPGYATVEAYCALVHELVTTLGLAAPLVAGHSLGAAIALTYAHTYPEHTAGLGLVGGGPRLPVSPKLLALLQSDLQSATERIVAGFYGPETPERTRARSLAALRACAPGVLLGDFEACARFDLTAALPSIHAPALVLCGAADRMVSPALSAELAAGLPDSRLVMLPDAGHMVMVERPAQVAKSFADFLDSWRYRV